MKYLLDTHVWIWYLLGDKKLNPRHRKAIEDLEAEIWLSPISLWETALLIERGRLPVRDNAARWIAKALSFLPVREAGLTFPIALRARALTGVHEDPADRFIAATAAELTLTLLTSDKRLRGSMSYETA